MPPPNFLLIQADQLAANAVAAYGNRVVQTPYIDSLVENGVIFRNAYCNFPICAPSRFSMMTGRLPSRIRAFDNSSEFPAELPTFAHYLRARGYDTCLSGKMHFVGPDQLHGFSRREHAQETTGEKSGRRGQPSWMGLPGRFRRRWEVVPEWCQLR